MGILTGHNHSIPELLTRGPIMPYSVGEGSEMGDNNRFEDKLPQIAEICRRHGVRELLLFGSALGPNFRPGSDIDFLVDFLPGKKIGLFEYAGMQMELESLLQRKVDLVSKRGLKPLIREDVLSQTWNVYAA